MPLPEFPPDRAVTATFGEALRGLVDREFCESRTFHEQQDRAARVGAHPSVLAFEVAFVRRMYKLGVPMFAAEMIRSSRRQDELYALGTTKARAGESAHNVGCAVDIVHSLKGWGLDKRQWALVGHIGREVAAQKGLRLEWGGGWKFYDPAHWELVGWQEESGSFPFPAEVVR